MHLTGKVNYYLVHKRMISGCPLESLLNYEIKEREELKE